MRLTPLRFLALLRPTRKYPPKHLPCKSLMQKAYLGCALRFLNAASEQRGSITQIFDAAQH
jgi:hypothetical protein